MGYWSVAAWCLCGQTSHKKSKTDKAGKIAELLDQEIKDRPIMVSQNMNRSHAEK